jgi:acyl carrier protein
MNAAFSRLSDLLIRKFGVAADEVSPSATFIDLDLDSLALVEIVLAVQEEFGVDVGDSELTPDDTLSAAADLLEAKGVRV